MNATRPAGSSGGTVRPRPNLSSLPRSARATLAAAGALARRRGLRLYLAGGVVRDLLSGAPARDVDLVVEADAADFARELAATLSASASVRVHDRFGTAVLTLPGGRRLDVASARRESYASPGALPAVESPATIREDLARRDFTVNAMALELSPRRGLLDPHGGLQDLKRGTLRALHPNSFVDDPTRALRAVRYANRYGFRLDPATRRAIAHGVDSGAFERVSGDRWRRELVKIFAEPGRATAVGRLRRLGLDAAIAPALARARDPQRRLRAAERIAATDAEASWLAYLLCWLDELRAGDLRRVADRLSLAGKERARLLAWPRTRRRLGRGISRLRASAIARRTAGLSHDELVAAAAALPATDRLALLDSRRSLAEAPLPIRGADLLAAGVPPGAAIGRALSRTRDALLDGRISPEEALDFALRAAREARAHA